MNLKKDTFFNKFHIPEYIYICLGFPGLRNSPFHKNTYLFDTTRTSLSSFCTSLLENTYMALSDL